jgi:hypothetical protein
MKNYANALEGVMVKRVDRAEEVTHNVVSEYKFYSARLKSDQAINLICTVGGSQYDVNSISAENGMVYIESSTKESWIKLTCPFGQISFAIIISAKISDERPRKIGYAAINAEHKKSPV